MRSVIRRFAATLPLPTYLVAMMVGPFASVEAVVPPTPQRAAPLPLRVISTRPNAGKLDFAQDSRQTLGQCGYEAVVVRTQAFPDIRIHCVGQGEAQLELGAGLIAGLTEPGFEWGGSRSFRKFKFGVLAEAFALEVGTGDPKLE